MTGRLDSTRAPSSPGGDLYTMAVAGVALSAEVALLIGATRGAAPVSLMAGHGAVLAAVGAWAFRPARRRARYPLLLWIATASFGPFGPAGVLLARALEWRYARQATDVEEWHAMLFPPTHVDENAELWRRIGQRASDRPAEQHVTPFLDVLSFGSISQRQSVVAIIAQQFNPAFAPALRAALCDQHNVIRVQAATAIAKIENEFLERSIRLEKATREAPDDPAAVLALANHCDDQAFAGLLDGTREEECRVKAAAGYRRFLESRPVDGTVRFRLARLQQRRGRWHEAEPLFRQLVTAGHPGADHWLMENLFAQGRYGEVRALVAAHSAAPDTGLLPEVAATVALWKGREAAA
ncbi:MAG TPA: hypothetical protein PLH72_00460 [Vicinamibacterales bacterium]|nr:hypothetical protein [Vicinamibacterales bacterium]